jgi:hypothetical protein
MPDEEGHVLCGRCNWVMELLPDQYAIPKAKPRGKDNPLANINAPIFVRLYQCKNKECRAVEMKIPDSRDQT